MNNEQIKIKTGVDGLDALLYWDKSGFDLEADYHKNILIVIRGMRGISKVNMAMEMMRGINKSISKDNTNCRFYSLDKNHDALTKKYKDLIGIRSSVDDIFPELDPQKETYLYTKMIQFNAITQNIGTFSEKKPLDCIVIDGFAGLAQKDFTRLPMETLEELLKKKARVSILVFDDRLTNFSTAADIIIEMRRSFSEQHRYGYYELQIAKNFLGPKANGWHKYCCTDNGEIIVYPSLHQNYSTTYYIHDRFKEQVLETNAKYPCPGIGNNNANSVSLVNALRAQPGVTTCIVGAHNTYKQRLATLVLAEILQKGDRALVILLNGNPTGFMQLLQSFTSYRVLNSTLLHVFNIPMGGISSSELMYMLISYIKKHKSNNYNLNIIMLDLAAIDYSFPMLRTEALLLPTVKELCRKENVSLTMISDKKSSLIDEICFVSDNVLCTRRENYETPLKEEVPESSISGTEIHGHVKGKYTSNITIEIDGQIDGKIIPCDDQRADYRDEKAGKLTIYLEKNNVGPAQNSRVYRFEVDDMQTVRQLSDLEQSTRTEICTTKDFWRQAWNVKNYGKQ